MSHVKLISASEGNDETSRWKWNETIGPVEDRPGREGTWGYYNTDGLGMCLFCKETLHI